MIFKTPLALASIITGGILSLSLIGCGEDDLDTGGEAEVAADEEVDEEVDDATEELEEGEATSEEGGSQ